MTTAAVVYYVGVGETPLEEYRTYARVPGVPWDEWCDMLRGPDAHRFLRAGAGAGQNPDALSDAYCELILRGDTRQARALARLGAAPSARAWTNPTFAFELDGAQQVRAVRTFMWLVSRTGGGRDRRFWLGETVGAQNLWDTVWEYVRLGQLTTARFIVVRGKLRHSPEDASQHCERGDLAARYAYMFSPTHAACCQEHAEHAAHLHDF